MDATRRLPPDWCSDLVEAGLFRLALPRAAGGAEVDLLSFLDVAEALAAADGSAGWCLVQGSFSAAQVVAFLRPEVVREVFGDGKTVLANGTGNGGTAVPVDGGYRLSGRWPFASGCTHATWYKAAARVVGARGRTRGVPGAGRRAAGDAHLPLPGLGGATWRTPGTSAGCGARGATPSPCEEVFVPPGGPLTWPGTRAWKGAPSTGCPPRCWRPPDSARWRWGSPGGPWTPSPRWPGARPPGGPGRPWARTRWCRTRWRGRRRRCARRRPFCARRRGAPGTCWRAGSALSARERALLRLAATHGSNQAAGVVDVVYHAAGATAIFEVGGPGAALPGRPRRDPADPVERPALPGRGARPAGSGGGQRLRLAPEKLEAREAGQRSLREETETRCDWDSAPGPWPGSRWRSRSPSCARRATPASSSSRTRRAVSTRRPSMAPGGRLCGRLLDGAGLALPSIAAHGNLLQQDPERRAEQLARIRGRDRPGGGRRRAARARPAS